MRLPGAGWVAAFVSSIIEVEPPLACVDETAPGVVAAGPILRLDSIATERRETLPEPIGLADEFDGLDLWEFAVSTCAVFGAESPLAGAEATAPGEVAAGTIRRLDSPTDIPGAPGIGACVLDIVSGPALLGVAETAPGDVAAGTVLRFESLTTIAGRPPGKLGCEVPVSVFAIIVSAAVLPGVAVAATAPGVVAAGANLRLDGPVAVSCIMLREGSDGVLGCTVDGGSDVAGAGLDETGVLDRPITSRIRCCFSCAERVVSFMMA